MAWITLDKCTKSVLICTNQLAFQENKIISMNKHTTENTHGRLRAVHSFDTAKVIQLYTLQAVLSSAVQDS